MPVFSCLSFASHEKQKPKILEYDTDLVIAMIDDCEFERGLNRLPPLVFK